MKPRLRLRIVLSIGLAAAGCASTAGAPGGGGDDDSSGDDVQAGFDASLPPGTPDAGPPGPHPDAATPPGPGPDAGGTGGPTIGELCFPGLGDPNKPRPDYDQFGPTVGSHCAGTNHQAIDGIEKVVFLGDSITEGTPPTLPTQYYRELLAWKLRERFGFFIEISECAAWGARADDLLLPPHQQIHDCFSGPEPKRTLVVMTLGGNDMNAIIGDAMEQGWSEAQMLAEVDAMLGLFRDAVTHLKDPANFPNGSFVVFANMYEYTDGTGEFESCPAAPLAGYSGSFPQARPAYIRANEQFMKIAVDTGSDMIFLLESFCGHGFHAGEPENECFRGADAETWFDLTCIHPNPVGHAQIADLFFATISE